MENACNPQAGEDLVGPADGSPKNPEEQKPHDKIIRPRGAGKGAEDFPVDVLVVERFH
jgi:hypothetical protein